MNKLIIIFFKNQTILNITNYLREIFFFLLFTIVRGVLEDGHKMAVLFHRLSCIVFFFFKFPFLLLSSPCLFVDYESVMLSFTIRFTNTVYARLIYDIWDLLEKISINQM